MANGKEPFTEPEDCIIAAGVRADLSFSEIAAELVRAGFSPRSRSAVIGRASRAGLAALRPKRPPKVAALSRHATPRPKRARGKAERPARAESQAPAPTLPVEELPAEAPVPCAAVPVPFTSVRERECRWPLWGHHEAPPIELRFLCGAPAPEGRVYCAVHHARAHVPRVQPDEARRGGHTFTRRWGANLRAGVEAE